MLLNLLHPKVVELIKERNYGVEIDRWNNPSPNSTSLGNTIQISPEYDILLLQPDITYMMLAPNNVCLQWLSESSANFRMYHHIFHYDCVIKYIVENDIWDDYYRNHIVSNLLSRLVDRRGDVEMVFLGDDPIPENYKYIEQFDILSDISFKQEDFNYNISGINTNLSEHERLACVYDIYIGVLRRRIAKQYNTINLTEIIDG